MSDRLAGRIALVTGAGTGIGKAEWRTMIVSDYARSSGSFEKVITTEAPPAVRSPSQQPEDAASDRAT